MLASVSCPHKAARPGFPAPSHGRCRRPRLQTTPMASLNSQSASKEQLDVAVIGGGPGGLAAAAAILAASPGLKVQVFERSVLRPRGAVVGVQANGQRALEAISPQLLQAVQGIHCPLGPRWHFQSDGSLLSREDGADSRTQFTARHSGLAPVACAWHELQSTLAAHLPPGTLHQQAAVEGYEEGPGGVTLRFHGGRRPLAARLLVGCDGGQSAVRAQLLGDGPPTFAGTAIWRAVLPRPAWWPQGPGSHCIFGVPPAMVLSFLLRGDSVGWQAFLPWLPERLEEIGGAGAMYTQDALSRREQGQARKLRALEALQGWCPEVVGMVEATDPVAITEHPQLYRHPDACKVWGRGRVTLAGDAAHLSTPLLTQGTSQAFEDAVALGRAIGQHGPTPEALRAYESYRQPQMEVVHRRSLALFEEFAAGGPPPQEHLENHSLGVWLRTFEPLSRAGGVAAA